MYSTLQYWAFATKKWGRMRTLLDILGMIQMFELHRLKMCGQFAGQFSRDNCRFVYIQVTDLFCNFSFLCESFDCYLVSQACIYRGREAVCKGCRAVNLSATPTTCTFEANAYRRYRFLVPSWTITGLWLQTQQQMHSSASVQKCKTSEETRAHH